MGEARRKRLKRLHCHPTVAKVAMEIVMESYDALMHHDEHWHAFKAQFPDKTSGELEQIYLDWNWGKGVDAARHTLARMLDPAVCPALTDKDRNDIHEALILDKSLMLGRETNWDLRAMEQAWRTH